MGGAEVVSRAGAGLSLRFFLRDDWKVLRYKRRREGIAQAGG